MKKITTFLALLLTCIIGATAADFVPVSGVKYLIKCKGDKNAVYMPEGTGDVVLQAKTEVTDASYFTIESKIVNEVTYFYIHPNSDATKYVYTETPSTDNNVNDGVVKIKTVSEGSDPDEACLWKIAFNTKTSAFNITPKGYDEYSWNCRSTGIGYWTTRYKNNEDNNSWYITPNVELNGYYTIKNTATDRFTNLYNDFGVDNITRAAENLPTPLANNYVWHVTTANGNVLTVLNGQGTPLYHDGNGNASLPTLNVAYSDRWVTRLSVKLPKRPTRCLFATSLTASTCLLPTTAPTSAGLTVAMATNHIAPLHKPLLTLNKTTGPSSLPHSTRVKAL